MHVSLTQIDDCSKAGATPPLALLRLRNCSSVFFGMHVSVTQITRW